MRESVTNRNVRNKTLHRLCIYIDFSEYSFIAEVLKKISQYIPFKGKALFPSSIVSGNASGKSLNASNLDEMK